MGTEVGAQSRLEAEIESLRGELEEARSLVTAIRSGAVDAFVMSEGVADRVYIVQSADRPYRLMVESMNQGALTVGADGLILFCNSKFASLLDCSRRSFVGRKLSELASAEQRAALEALLHAARQRPATIEVMLQQHAGPSIPVLLSISRLPQVDPAALCVLVTDLRERKTHEELLRTQVQLRRSEQRLRKIYEHAQVGICIRDREGRLVQCNPAYRHIVGYNEPELLWMNFSSLLHPDDRAAHDAQCERLVRGEIPHFTLECRYVHQSGRVIWAQKFVSALRDPGGELNSYLALLVDVSERKAADKALRESEQQLQLAKKAANLGIHDWNIATGEIRWDQRCRELWGVPPAQTITCEFLMEHLHPDDRAATQQAVDRAIDPQGDGTYFVQYRVRSAADGIERWVETVGRVFFQDERPVRLVGTVQDISKRKRAEMELAVLAEEREYLLESERAARSELERAMRCKDDFLGTLSHELRTPLNAIVGWAGVLRVARDEAAIKEGLDAIERGAMVQTRLIEDLLDLNRIMSGKLSLDMGRVNLVSTVEAAVDTVRLRAQDKGVRLVVDVDPSSGAVYGDESRLMQVFWNLLSNAVKFTPRGGTVHVDMQRRDEEVVVTVRDTGSGISADFLPHVFERFSQEKGPSRASGGLGIGLSIVRHLVEMQGGTVSAHSGGEGQGATFTVTLRSAGASMDGVVALKGRAEGQQPDALLKGKCVLLVDDDDETRQALRRLLEDAGVHMHTAESTEEGLRVLQSVKPDLLLSDIGMPGPDGFELIQRVRSLDAREVAAVPAIAVTAFARPEDRRRALHAGFNVHMTKPIEPRALMAAMATLLRDQDQQKK